MQQTLSQTKTGLSLDENDISQVRTHHTAYQDPKGEDVFSDDLLGHEFVDLALARKMHIINDTIDEIGWTPFHTKLFFLNGFGYAADSMVAILQGVISTQAYIEFGSKGYPTGMTIALYSGFLSGALFWGFGADMIGRKLAFNVTLGIASVATIVTGAAPSWAVMGLFISLIGFGAGGNLVLDSTIFLEFLPSNKQWTVTALAAWWGVGQTMPGFAAWGFYSQPQWNCDPASAEGCTWHNNKAWRLVTFTIGALMMVLSILRLTVIRLEETPKYLVTMGRDRELTENFQQLAAKYNRPCSLTLEQLEACGNVEERQGGRISRRLFKELGLHLKGLFATKKLALSTSLVWASWVMIGLAHPLFFVFLPAIIANRVPSEPPSVDRQWRDFTISNVCAIFGPLIAGVLCNTKYIGRRYTMVIGALVTMAFFFGYSAITTATQNLAFSAVISCCIYIYYGTLYAYTVEVFPSRDRATGNGIGMAMNRLMGLISGVIAVAADTSSPVPLYICAGLFAVLAGVSAGLPFEPYGSRSS